MFAAVQNRTMNLRDSINLMKVSETVRITSEDSHGASLPIVGQIEFSRGISKLPHRSKELLTVKPEHIKLMEN